MTEEQERAAKWAAVSFPSDYTFYVESFWLPC